jgi:tetratricopeptide (TPR) repeat protein
MLRRKTSNDDGSLTGSSTAGSVFSRRSFHSFSSTATPVQSNRRGARVNSSDSVGTGGSVVSRRPSFLNRRPSQPGVPLPLPPRAPRSVGRRPSCRGDDPSTAEQTITSLRSQSSSLPAGVSTASSGVSSAKHSAIFAAADALDRTESTIQQLDDDRDEIMETSTPRSSRSTGRLPVRKETEQPATPNRGRRPSNESETGGSTPGSRGRNQSVSINVNLRVSTDGDKKKSDVTVECDEAELSSPRLRDSDLVYDGCSEDDDATTDDDEDRESVYRSSSGLARTAAINRQANLRSAGNSPHRHIVSSGETGHPSNNSRAATEVELASHAPKLGRIDMEDLAFLEVEKNLEAIHTMASEHLRHGEYVEALEVFEEILRGQLARYGPDHFRVGTALHNIGIVHMKRGDYRSAARVSKEAVRVRKKALDPFHPDVSVSLAQLGVAYMESSKHRKAITVFREALRIRRRVSGARHWKNAKILNNIGCALYELNELRVALIAFEEALDIQRDTLRQSPGDPSSPFAAPSTVSDRALLSIASTLSNIGSIKLYWGQYMQAAVDLEEALLIQQSVLGDDHPVASRTRESLVWVERVLSETGDNEKGVDEADESGPYNRLSTAFSQLSSGIMSTLSQADSGAIVISNTPTLCGSREDTSSPSNSPANKSITTAPPTKSGSMMDVLGRFMGFQDNLLCGAPQQPQGEYIRTGIGSGPPTSPERQPQKKSQPAPVGDKAVPRVKSGRRKGNPDIKVERHDTTYSF